MSEYLAMQESIRTASAAARIIAQHWPDMLMTYTYNERTIIQRFLYDFLPEEDRP